MRLEGIICAIFCSLLLFRCNEPHTVNSTEEPLPEMPPAVLTGDQPIAEKLSYAASTDQSDRALITEKDLISIVQKKSSLKLDSIDFRDSLRFDQVRSFFDNGDARSCQDKYNTALVFLHGGGARTDPGFAYHAVSAVLFAEVLEDSLCKELHQDAESFRKEAERRSKLDLENPSPGFQFGIEEVGD